ncbi:ParA family protein [Methylobacterium sp. 2A]|nr:ParA family protein [Methylobacterium sp. 2A]MWV25143.1 ParA family protein [Methylobacterium sp. 2A]
MQKAGVTRVQIIAVAARKGGVGKTTLVTHLSVASWQAGLRTKVIDLDPQTTASEWADARGDDAPDVISAQSNRLSKILEAIREDTDIVYLDTPPAAGDAGAAAIEAANLVLIPCRIQAADLAAVLRSYDSARGQDRRAVVVFNDESPQRRKSIVDETNTVLAMKGIETAPVVIHSRIAYGESQDQGRTVLETDPNSVAADEMRQLYTWVTKQLNQKGAKAEKSASKK